jgi:sodium-dependent phosphate cotransporter
VGIVGGGGLTVSNAIPIIMGANIGTTVTNTLVALAHVTRREEFKRAISAATVHDFFNFICVCIMFPLELATGFLEKCATKMSILFEDVGGIKFVSPIKLATKPTIHFIQDGLHLLVSSSFWINTLALILSIVVLFFSLYFIVKITKSLVIRRAEIVLDNVIHKSSILGLIAGLAFTVIVQSSSITTSLLVPLVAAGILTLESSFSVTMGANIGTTGTAILASFATGNPAAIVVAFEHFLFNTTGVLLIYPFKALRMIPISLAGGFGNLAAQKRTYAFLYVLGVFFLVPALLILISKLLN